jgi:hypothetical protein
MYTRKAGWRRGQRVGPITQRSEVRTLHPLAIFFVNGDNVRTNDLIYLVGLISNKKDI